MRLDSSHQRTSWQDVIGRSSPSATASWRPRASGGERPAKRVGRHKGTSPSRCPRRSTSLCWKATRAEDRAPWRHDPSADPGAKTEGGRHDAALSFPFGIGTKAANRPHLFWCSVCLASQPRFLHFTLNQHTRPIEIDTGEMLHQYLLNLLFRGSLDQVSKLKSGECRSIS